MVSFLNTKKRQGRQPAAQRTTTISFSVQDLAELGQVLAVGQAVLQKRLPVSARLKAAMTRLRVPVPDQL
jgi:hypothetical protein